MNYIKIIIGSLLAGWSVSGSTQVSDDILDYLPALIAASQKTCDLSNIATCNTETICKRSGGYWYWTKCNRDPLGLVLIKRLIGTWDFTFDNGGLGDITKVYMFPSSTITPNGSSGDYKIVGNDITYSHIQRNVTAIYDLEDDILRVTAPETSFNSPISGVPIRVPPDYWFLDFVSANILVGLHSSLVVSPLFPPNNQASAVKR